jgi:hypothetical protein
MLKSSSLRRTQTQTPAIPAAPGALRFVNLWQQFHLPKKRTKLSERFVFLLLFGGGSLLVLAVPV